MGVPGGKISGVAVLVERDFVKSCKTLAYALSLYASISSSETNHHVDLRMEGLYTLTSSDADIILDPWKIFEKHVARVSNVASGAFELSL